MNTAKLSLMGLISLTVLIMMAGVVAYEPVTMDRYQRRIDQMPRSNGIAHAYSQMGGEIVFPPSIISMGTTPLTISSAVVVQGTGPHATILDYDGTGYAILFKSYGGSGFCEQARIENLSIDSASGGIGIDNSTVTGTFARNTIRNCLIRANGGSGISLWTTMAGFQNNYFNRVEQTHIIGYAASALESNSSNFYMDGVWSANNATMNALPSSGPVFKLEGGGMMVNSWCEAYVIDTQPQLEVAGSWTMKNNHMEYHLPSTVNITGASGGPLVAGDSITQTSPSVSTTFISLSGSALRYRGGGELTNGATITCAARGWSATVNSAPYFERRTAFKQKWGQIEMDEPYFMSFAATYEVYTDPSASDHDASRLIITRRFRPTNVADIPPNGGELAVADWRTALRFDDYIQCNTVTPGTIAIGDTITGSESGATGRYLGMKDLNGGTLTDGDVRVYYEWLSGTFQNGASNAETITNGAKGFTVTSEGSVVNVSKVNVWGRDVRDYLPTNKGGYNVVAWPGW